MIEVDPDVRELLARWAISPIVPVSELTAEAVRTDDRGVLALQRTPGALHSVEDIEVMGRAGSLSVRVYRPSPGRLHPVPFLHGGGFVVGRQGYDAPLRELALASG
jgi:acetyl esterase